MLVLVVGCSALAVQVAVDPVLTAEMTRFPAVNSEAVGCPV